MEPTRDELRVLAALADGATDAAAMARLGMSRRSFQRHLARVMDKLGARSRFQAGVLAERAGWIDRKESAC